MIMKLIRFLVLGIFVFNIPVLLYAQKKNKPLLSTVDKKGQTVSPENAFYLDVRTYRNDSTWEFSRYLYAGPIVFLKTYRDREMTELHGYVAYYDSRGRVDSSGYISGGQKDSWWNYFTDSLTVYETVVYKNGQVTYRQDRQKPGSEQKKPDSTAIIVEKEAYFKKGAEEWTKYIQKTIKIPKRFQSLGHTESSEWPLSLTLMEKLLNPTSSNLLNTQQMKKPCALYAKAPTGCRLFRVGDV